MTDTFRDTLQTALGASFVLDRELGGGGMSRVFVARDGQLDRNVVVKVLAPELVQELSVERFGREIALAAALQHANIVPVLAAGVTSAGLPYYLMPFVDGTSVRARIDGEGRLPVNDVVLILSDVCRALAYAHARGVVHRDIKPDNVMLSGGAAVVTDFGIAKAMSSSRNVPTDEKLTRMGTSLGTAAYMAPEQGAGDPSTDHRADLYALGAMAYEMLAGVTPFGERPAHALLIAHLTETPADLAAARPDAPDALVTLVMRCLEKDPDARPHDAAAVLELLADAASDARTGSSGQPARATSGQTAPHSSRGPAARPRSRVPMLVGAAVVVVAAVSWFAMRRSSAPTGPDTSLLAVMPFTVRDASLDIWREGLVDVLSRNLDGAGTLRTVAASTSIARAPQRADKATAIAHGRALGAGLVLFGDLSPIGADSVRARVTVVNVATESVRDVEARGETSRMDAMTDSLSLTLLRELGSTADLGGAARTSSIGTTQLPALKAYLRGLQFARRATMDSSLAAFREAVTLDSTFSLAWRGVASVYIRSGREAAPEATDALNRAIRFGKGRSPRDSMLLHADSLRLAVLLQGEIPNEPIADIKFVPRLFQALADATQRYPSDAELWLEYGDAAFHFADYVGVGHDVVLRHLMRAVALDSNVLVPQIHAATTALRLGELRNAAQRFHAVARLTADSQASAYYKLQATVLDSAPQLSDAARAALGAAPVTFSATVLRELSPFAAGQPLVADMAKAVRGQLTAKLSADDSARLGAALAMAEASAGRIDDAIAKQLTFGERTQLAQGGVWPVQRAADEARAALAANQGVAAASGLGMLAMVRDTASIARILAALEQYDASRPATADGKRPPQFADVARAWQSLARGDSSAALQKLLALPTSLCGGAPCAGFSVAKLLVAAKRDGDAAKVLDRWLPTGQQLVGAPPAMLLRAQVAERLSDRATAKRWFDAVIGRWSAGSPAVQPTVNAARDGLKRIGGR